MHLRRRLPVVLGILASCAASGALAQTVHFSIDPSQRFQTMEGFGTALDATDSFVPYSNDNFGTARYAQFATDYAHDLGASLVRVDINPDALPAEPPGGLTGNLQNDISQLNFQAIYVRLGLNAAAAFNAQKIDRFGIVGTIWTPPPWMKANNAKTALPQPDGSYNDPNNHLKFDPSNPNNIDPTTLTQFARYVAAYVAGIQQTVHVPVTAISLQNEPTFNEPYNSCSYYQHYAYSASDPQFARYAQVVKAVGEEFLKDGITTKIIGPEITGPDGPISSNDAVGYFTHQQYNFVAAMKADSTPDQYGKTAIDYLSAHATHPFGVQFPSTSRDTWTYYKNLYSSDGKPIWVTETLGESPAWLVSSTDASGAVHRDGALILAQHIHNALAYGNASTFMYWQAADSSPDSQYNLMDSSDASVQNPERSDAPNYKYDVLKHYSRFIRPGAIRLATGPTDAAGNFTAEDPAGVNVDAWLDADNHRLTLEMINIATTPQTVDLTLPLSLGTRTFHVYLTASGEPWERLPDVSAAGSDLQFTMPPESVVTLDADAFGPARIPEPGGIAILSAIWLLKVRRRTPLCPGN